MRVHLSDPRLLDTFRGFLERLGCEVERVGEDDGTLFVTIPRSELEAARRLELDLYLRMWEAVNPDAPAVLVA